MSKRPLLKLHPYLWMSYMGGPDQLPLRTVDRGPRWKAFERELTQSVSRVGRLRPHVRSSDWKRGWPPCIATIKDGSRRCKALPLFSNRTKAPKNGLCRAHGADHYPTLDPGDLTDADGRPLRRKKPPRDRR